MILPALPNGSHSHLLREPYPRQEENLKFLALPTVSKANNSYASKAVILSEFPSIRKENIKLLRLFCQSDSDQRLRLPGLVGLITTGQQS